MLGQTTGALARGLTRMRRLSQRARQRVQGLPIRASHRRRGLPIPPGHLIHQVAGTEDVTWFLAICAVLLELKVGRLLPRHVDETEEELLGGASPDLVYARSLELRAFRRVAEDLAARMAEAALLVPRSAGPPPGCGIALPLGTCEPARPRSAGIR